MFRHPKERHPPNHLARWGDEKLSIKKLQGHPHLAFQKMGPNDMRSLSTYHLPVARALDQLGGGQPLAPSGW